MRCTLKLSLRTPVTSRYSDIQRLKQPADWVNTYVKHPPKTTTIAKTSSSHTAQRSKTRSSRANDHRGMQHSRLEDQDHVLRSEPCERKAKTWLHPVHRLVHGVQPAQFPDRDVGLTIKILTTFARILSQGYSIFTSIAPAQDSLFRSVLAQYYHFVLKPAELWAKGKIPDCDRLRDLRTQVLKVEALMPQDHVADQWISLTVFDLMYAALASRFGPEAGLQERIEKDAYGPQIIGWRVLARPFTPCAITYDIESQIVGLSGIRWGRIPELKEWEARLRDARIAPEVRSYLTETQAMFRQIDETSSSETQIKEAIEVTNSLPEDDQVCNKLCGGRLWYTISGMKLRQKDPCSMCRACYHRTFLLEGVLVPASTSLFEIQGERAWQCAESCIMSQLWDLSQQEMRETHQRAPLSNASRFVSLTSTEWRSGACGHPAEEAALRRSALSVAVPAC